MLLTLNTALKDILQAGEEKVLPFSFPETFKAGIVEHHTSISELLIFSGAEVLFVFGLSKGSSDIAIVQQWVES